MLSFFVERVCKVARVWCFERMHNIQSANTSQYCINRRRIHARRKKNRSNALRFRTLYLGAGVVFSCLKNENGVKQKHFRSHRRCGLIQWGKTNRSDKSHADHVSRTCQWMQRRVKRNFLAICSNNTRSQFFCCKLTVAQCTSPFNAMPFQKNFALQSANLRHFFVRNDIAFKCTDVFAVVRSHWNSIHVSISSHCRRVRCLAQAPHSHTWSGNDCNTYASPVKMWTFRLYFFGSSSKWVSFSPHFFRVQIK